MGVEDLLAPGERAAVERILSAATDRGVRLEAAAQIRPEDGRVLRVSTADGSWIVKRAGSRDEDRLYGPWGFFAEWVGAATATAAAPGVGPDFLGGDADEVLLVFADVGSGRDVSQVLRGDDPQAARRALVAMGASLGRLHAATAPGDVEADHRARWRALCGDRPGPRIPLPATLVASLTQALAKAGVEVRFAPEVVDELEAWAHDGGAGRSLIHGDPCLDNWILDADGRPLLIDFQGAIFAPAALDAAYARSPFPTCWCLRRLPAEVVHDFEEAHRGALVAAGLASGDPSQHRRDLTFATGWWFAVQLLWRIEEATAADARPPAVHLGFPLVPHRDAILLRCASFLELSAATGALASFADQAAALRTELLRRWSAADIDVDLYPAFGGEPA